MPVCPNCGNYVRDTNDLLDPAAELEFALRNVDREDEKRGFD